MTDRIAPAAHPIHAIMAERWSPRAFDEHRTVSEAELASLLEAARWAASCFNEQPWLFCVARRDANPAEFATLLSCLSENNQGWAKRAGVLMIGLARQSFAANGNPNVMANYDLGQAVAQMALQAVAMGLVSHQMRGFDVEKARRSLNVPTGTEPMVAIAFGHLAAAAILPEALAAREVAPRLRKTAAEFSRIGGF